MSKRRVSLMEFMENQNLVQKEPALPLEDLRKEIEAGALLKDLERTAGVINQAAGSLLIDVQSYLWPEPLIRSFSVQKKREEFVMQLELWDGRPALTFILRKARETLLSRFLPWVITHWLGLHEIEVAVKSSSVLNVDLVTSRDIEGWFIYLLSGFDRSLLPTVPGPGKDGRSSEVAAREISSREPLIADEIS
jgi:hypothetical protein